MNLIKLDLFNKELQFIQLLIIMVVFIVEIIVKKTLVIECFLLSKEFWHFIREKSFMVFNQMVK